MPIMDYPQYMQAPIGKGRIGLYPEFRADTLAAAEAIGWGRAVQRNASNKNRADLYDGSGEVAGIAIAQHYAEYRTTNVQNDITGEYSANEAVSVLRKGAIWVEVLEDVVEGDLAVADNATGDFRPADTATTTISKPLGEFKSAAAANGLALLEINLPFVTVTIETESGGA